MSTNIFAEGVSCLAKIQTNPESTNSEKLLAEGLIRTLDVLYSEVLALREKVESLQK